LHPKHPQFEKLRQALLAARKGGAAKVEPAAEPAKVAIAPGPTLKPGMDHPDVALVRDRLGVTAEPGRETVYDKALVTAVKAFQEERGQKVTGVVTIATRTALNGGEAKGKPATAADPARNIERIVLNMERLRWLPADLGRFHIQNNVPEYMTRVFKDGKIIHQEKIIVGKTQTPTSIFSANMQFVIFHPEWGVPDSIKLKELWPSLRRKVANDDFFGLGGGVSDTRVLQKHNLRVSQNGRPIDASKVDWSTVDPRQFQFIQPAGGTNVLGVVKFRFPNRHDIYMHDTPQRELFNQSVRTFSHGCMRVNNPRRLAEVILAEDRGWTPDRVGAQIASPQSLEVKLEKQLPVHVTYFTARVDEDGSLKTFADVYGHDARLASALAGKPVKLEEPEQPSETIAQTAKPKRGQPLPQKQVGLDNLFQGLFGN
jgi:L,D-transpeptidase YcbB